MLDLHLTTCSSWGSAEVRTCRLTLTTTSALHTPSLSKTPYNLGDNSKTNLDLDWLHTDLKGKGPQDVAGPGLHCMLAARCSERPRCQASVFARYLMTTYACLRLFGYPRILELTFLSSKPAAMFFFCCSGKELHDFTLAKQAGLLIAILCPCGRHSRAWVMQDNIEQELQAFARRAVQITTNNKGGFTRGVTRLVVDDTACYASSAYF